MATFNQQGQVVTNQFNTTDRHISYISLFLGMYLLGKEIPEWLRDALAESKFDIVDEWNIYSLVAGAPGDSSELRSMILALVKDVK